MRTTQEYLFRVCWSKEVSHYHLHFDRDSKSGRGVGNLYSGRREVFSYVLIRGCRKRKLYEAI